MIKSDLVARAIASPEEEHRILSELSHKLHSSLKECDAEIVSEALEDIWKEKLEASQPPPATAL
jgi:hypothetical protein